MQFTANATLIIEIEDVDAMCCYRDRDGYTFEESLQFEIQLQDLILKPSCILAIDFPVEMFLDPYYEAEKIMDAVQHVIQKLYTAPISIY